MLEKLKNQLLNRLLSEGIPITLSIEKSMDEFFNTDVTDEIAMAREEGRKKEENRWINQSANEHDNRIKKEALKDFLVYMDDKGLWNSHWHREEIKSRIEYYIKEFNKKI